MVFAGPLEEPSLLLERPDPSQTLLSLINKLQEFFLITPHPSENSSIKGAE